MPRSMKHLINDVYSLLFLLRILKNCQSSWLFYCGVFSISPVVECLMTEQGFLYNASFPFSAPPISLFLSNHTQTHIHMHTHMCMHVHILATLHAILDGEIRVQVSRWSISTKKTSLFLLWKLKCYSFSLGLSLTVLFLPLSHPSFSFDSVWAPETPAL